MLFAVTNHRNLFDISLCSYAFDPYHKSKCFSTDVWHYTYNRSFNENVDDDNDNENDNDNDNEWCFVFTMYILRSFLFIWNRRCEKFEKKTENKHTLAKNEKM